MKVWIRGAGELASGTAWTLKRCGWSVLLTELPLPLAIRRPVTFSDAMLERETEVEGIRAQRVADPTPADWHRDWIPVTEDRPERVLALNPRVIIDARMRKQAVPDRREWAALVIGLGPGFTVGVNCSAAVETRRGHDLGRVLWQGSPAADTRRPGTLGGASWKRVLYAPASGPLEWQVTFGDLVEEGNRLGTIAGRHPIVAPLSGQVRGLLHPAVPVHRGLKLADVDPRGAEVDYRTLSDKARTVGRAALEAILTAQQEGRL
ncbi:MAG: EF2563 family selenium-dependent molybdenum hydroxylase system protein [Candidatus Neomarinimicrobiota bacterium]|nr:MAG: EF2563 family selenium-dependent molybdenum hydroxylase system protein [Candidatus Neomarinimicrobiota bacterium]